MVGLPRVEISGVDQHSVSTHLWTTLGLTWVKSLRYQIQINTAAQNIRLLLYCVEKTAI